MLRIDYYIGNFHQARDILFNHFYLTLQSEKTVLDETRLNKSKETFQHLKEMKIKFPGKSDEEAGLLLSTVLYSRPADIQRRFNVHTTSITSI